MTNTELNLIDAAIELHDYMQANAGIGAEWPINIQVDEDIKDDFLERLQYLNDAVNEFKRSGLHFDA